MTYLITFSCYGCHIHGHESGSIEPDPLRGARWLEPNRRRVGVEQRRMDQPPYALDASRRAAVLAALQQNCSHRGWSLLAAHVRSSHVHLVIEAEAEPERVMNDLKSYASRWLNRIGVDAAGRKRWTRHGSTRWLWDKKGVSAAIRYVVDGQGEPMAVFEA